MLAPIVGRDHYGDPIRGDVDDGRGGPASWRQRADGPTAFRSWLPASAQVGALLAAPLSPRGRRGAAGTSAGKDAVSLAQRELERAFEADFLDVHGFGLLESQPTT